MSERPSGLIVEIDGEDVEIADDLGPAHRRGIDVDRSRHRITVETDAVGLHPVYRAESDDTAALSATKSAAAEALGGVTVDPPTIARTLADWRRDPRETIYREIRRLPPETRTVVDLRTGELSHEQRDESPWDRPMALPTFDEPDAALRELLRDRVARVVDGASEISAALSGGLDSSTLVALAADLDGSPEVWMLEDGAGRTEEQRHAERLVDDFSLDVRRVEVSPEALPEHFEATARHAEGPVINPRGVSKFVLFRAAADVDAGPFLSGMGADEVFAGKSWAWSVDDEGHPNFARGGLRKREVAHEFLRDGCSARESRVSDDCDFTELRRLGLEFLTRRLLFPLEIHGPAAVGLDLALPFLDDEMIRFAAGLGREELLGEEFGKVLLREAMAPILGEAAAWQPKEAVLQPPAGGDDAARGEWADLVDGWLTRRRLERLEVVDPSRVRDAVDEYATADRTTERFAALERVLLHLTSLAIRIDGNRRP